jgi:preprotein translocase subunit SecD/SecD/SecF fusion protein
MFGFKAPTLRLLAAHVIPSHPGFWGVDQDIAEAERRFQEAQKARGAKVPASSAKGGEARA